MGDPAIVIEVLETSGYNGLARNVAHKVHNHDDYVRISLDHFKDYTQTIEFLRTLPIATAGRLLLAHGGVLVKKAPERTVDLLRDLCGLSGILWSEATASTDFQGDLKV